MKVFYTSNTGTIKKISDDIFISDLIDVLDKEIERIKSYER